MRNAACQSSRCWERNLRKRQSIKIPKSGMIDIVNGVALKGSVQRSSRCPRMTEWEETATEFEERKGREQACLHKMRFDALLQPTKTINPGRSGI